MRTLRVIARSAFAFDPDGDSRLDKFNGHFIRLLKRMADFRHAVNLYNKLPLQANRGRFHLHIYRSYRLEIEEDLKGLADIATSVVEARRAVASSSAGGAICL